MMMKLDETVVILYLSVSIEFVIASTSYEVKAEEGDCVGDKTCRRFPEGCATAGDPCSIVTWRPVTVSDLHMCQRFIFWDPFLRTSGIGLFYMPSRIDLRVSDWSRGLNDFHRRRISRGSQRLCDAVNFQLITM